MCQLAKPFTMYFIACLFLFFLFFYFYDYGHLTGTREHDHNSKLKAFIHEFF